MADVVGSGVQPQSKLARSTCLVSGSIEGRCIIATVQHEPCSKTEHCGDTARIGTFVKELFVGTNSGQRDLFSCEVAPATSGVCVIIPCRLEL